MKTLPLKVAVVSCTLDHTFAGKESSNAVDGRLTTGMGSTARPPTTTRHDDNGIIPTVALSPRGGDSNENKNHSKDSKAKRGSSKKKKKGSRKKRDTSPVGSSDENDDENDVVNDDVSSSNERKSNDKGAATTGIVEEILGQDDYYMVLGVSRAAAKTEIKKAYRKRAVQTHPDKTGGDRRAFDKVSEAYDVLSDDDKRQVYNRFGKDALDGTTGSSTSPYQDLFRSMFRQQQQAQANRSVRYQLQVTLEDLYNGKTHNIEVGSPYSRYSGKKRVTCHIPKGSSSGQRIVLSGEMDFTDDVPGDIVFILSQAPHPVFSRKGSDLAMELTISLEEALCGFCRKIKHLNGNDVWIESARNEDKPVIIQTGDVQALSGYGMPIRGTNDFGDLFIQFRVEMPKPPSGKCTLSDKEQHELSRLLTKLAGGPAKKQHRKVESLVETSSLTVASVRDFGRPSGHMNIDGDDHIYEDEGGEFQSFFSSGGFFGSGPVRSSFYFGGAKGGYEDDSSDTQCQQM